MEFSISQKRLGALVALLAILLAVPLYISLQNTLALRAQLHKDCTLPAEVCPLKPEIPGEYHIAFFILLLIFASGAYLFLTATEPQKLSMMNMRELRKRAKSLSGDEKNIYDILLQSDGMLFQNELVDKSGLNKVKVTRVLDKLEGRGLIERKRRGMGNVVIVKHAQPAPPTGNSS